MEWSFTAGRDPFALAAHQGVSVIEVRLMPNVVKNVSHDSNSSTDLRPLMSPFVMIMIMTGINGPFNKVLDSTSQNILSLSTEGISLHF